MYEDLSDDLPEICQAIMEDERRRRYLKEIEGWLVEEYFEPNQAS
ncbi:MAG: hypothetical protein A4E45_00077 [Methanosaeta sp. PtaB.Bin039]|nr:MAG: hypothetical protein A4E45_00077 [Methanosaeta sp. PtaB.Bin039]OPY47607.1 MAG: hypothetical protein A4E47_00201 [Methanosaeta sp. PtaU1.Bin028]HOT06888.1 hypothetical protein [Methanotrichaceae archaeon]HQF16490.1 hypothetical protein [Methanotrichaceae archaeon]HQI91913.1 hypothetical protein [Methanotrichaceae archaeon]